MREQDVAHVPEDRQRMGLVTEFNASENLIFGYHHQQPFSKSSVMMGKNIFNHSKKIMRDYDVRPQSPFLLTSNFSGGNQQKLVISRELSAQPKMMIISQPTRGVDISGRNFIHQKILDYSNNGGSVILASEELDELLFLSTKIAVVFRGMVMGIKDSSEIDIDQIGKMMLGVNS